MIELIACPLVCSVGDYRTDSAATQVASNFICAIALVADESFWACAWSSTSHPSHRAVFHQRLEGGLLMTFATREHEDQWLALPFGTHVRLGTEPTTTSIQCLLLLPPFARAAC